MLPPLVLNLVISLHSNSWAARTPGGGDVGWGGRWGAVSAEQITAYTHDCIDLHIPLTPSTPTQAATPT